MTRRPGGRKKGRGREEKEREKRRKKRGQRKEKEGGRERKRERQRGDTISKTIYVSINKLPQGWQFSYFGATLNRDPTARGTKERKREGRERERVRGVACRDVGM